MNAGKVALVTLKRSLSRMSEHVGLEVSISCARKDALGATETLFSRMGTHVCPKVTSLRGRVAALCTLESFFT